MAVGFDLALGGIRSEEENPVEENTDENIESIDAQTTSSREMYDRLDDILSKYEITEREYLNLTRTPQHRLNPVNRELVYNIRMELTVDVSSSNKTYLNEIWTRNSLAQIEELSNLTGIDESNIVCEKAESYNRATNPDTGTGITLNQGDSESLGLPEFYAKKGLKGIKEV